MKKFIALLIALFTLLLASCGETVVNMNTEPTVMLYASSVRHVALEMKSRVLLAGSTGILYYYSKADGESYPFCFDPLCPHTYSAMCPAVLFNHSLSGQTQMYYNEYDNRVYAARGQQIYSMSFDASDLRLECSLGEKGKIESGVWYASMDISELKAYENYLYFMYDNPKTGHTQVYRYDMKKRELEEMTSADDWVTWYSFADGYIYVIAVIDEHQKCYTTDYEFKEKHFFENQNTSTIYDGKYFYGIRDGEIIAYNPITEEKKVTELKDDLGEHPNPLAIYNGYLYCTPYVVGGYSIGDKQGFNKKNIVRVSMDGKSEEVFDLYGYNIDGLNFVSDGVIMYMRYMVIHDGQGTVLGERNWLFIHCDIAEDGRFINPKPIGAFAEDAELIEYLAKN